MSKAKASQKPQVQIKLEKRGWKVSVLKDGSVTLTAKGYKDVKGTSLTNAYINQRGL